MSYSKYIQDKQNRREAFRTYPAPQDCFATATFPNQEPITVLVSDISSMGAGLIIEGVHFPRQADQLQLDYLELDLSAKIVNRRELPDGAIRAGVCFQESDYDDIQSQVSDKEYQLPRHLIFIQSTSGGNICLEQVRNDGCHRIPVTEDELTEIIEFLAWYGQCAELENECLELGSNIQVRRFANDSSFLIQCGVDLLFGSGDIRQHLHPVG